MISADGFKPHDNFRLIHSSQFQKVESQLPRLAPQFEEEHEEDMNEFGLPDEYEMEEEEEGSEISGEESNETIDSGSFLESTEAAFIHKIQSMYPTISPKCLQGITSKRTQVLNIFNQTTSELFVYHYEVCQQLNNYIQQQQLNNTPLTEKEAQEKLNFLNERIAFWVDEIKKTCEKSLVDYIQKFGKRRNRALPMDSTSILKQWFIKNMESPYPTEEQKLQLEKETNLSVTQINNWFINKRVRIWKPLITKLKNKGENVIRAQLKHAL